MDTVSADQVIEYLIHEYYKLVFHTIYGLTGNWEESQDLTQDTFHQALKGIDAARKASGPNFHAKAWILQIALNTVRIQRRRRNLFRFIPFSSMGERKTADQDTKEQNETSIQEQALPVQPDGYGSTGSSDPAELIAERDLVQKVMSKLPEPLRVCLLLSVVAGLTPAEIATLLTIKEAAVRQRLSRARKQFKDLYLYESKTQQGAPAKQEYPDIHKNATQYAAELEAGQQRMMNDSSQSLLFGIPASQTGNIYG